MLKKIGLLCTKGPDDVVITHTLPREITKKAFSTIDPKTIKGTVFDPDLEMRSGWIKVPRGARLFIPDRIREVKDKEDNNLQLWGEEDYTDVLTMLKDAGCDQAQIDDLIVVANGNTGIRVPMKINRAFELHNGIMVVDDLQRSFDRFAGRCLFPNDMNMIQVEFERLCVSIYDIIFKKRGLIDNLVGCRMPFSARAVIAPCADLDIWQIGIPESTLRLWIRNPEVQNAYGNISMDNLRDMWVLAGRQPTHLYENVTGYQVVPVRGEAILIHPMMAHRAHSDFDGDTMHVHLMLTEEARLDLKTKASSVASHQLKRFRFNKEYKKLYPGAVPQNANALNALCKKLSREVTTGLSLNYHDLVRDGKGTGYLDHVDTDQLKAYALGISASNLVGHDDNHDGRSFADAIRCQRVLKSGTAKAGGLTNSLGQLAICATWNNIESDQSIEILRAFGRIKHEICQNQLASKHGNLAPETVMAQLQTMFYRLYPNELETKEDYLGFLVEEAKLNPDDAEIVVDTFFSMNPGRININHVLNDLNPVFRATRSRSSMALLDKMCKPTVGFHANILF